MKKMMWVFVIISMFVITGCSRVTVPPATLGKVLSASGYSTEVIEPGKYWIPWWNNMVILDTGTQIVKEIVDVKMNDRLDSTFEIRFRSRIAGNERVINSMFNDIRHEKYAVTLGHVYDVYGRDVVRATARSVLSKYDTEDVPQNFDRITAELVTSLNEALKNSPLEMSNVTLGKITYPPTITDAINAQAERRLAIETETNQQAIEMVKRTNQLKLAEADYAIRMEKARTIRDENLMTADGLNPMLLQYRALEVQEKMADNSNAIFVPYDALGSVGLQNRVFSK